MKKKNYLETYIHRVVKTNAVEKVGLEAFGALIRLVILQEEKDGKIEDMSVRDLMDVLHLKRTDAFYRVTEKLIQSGYLSVTSVRGRGQKSVYQIK